MAKRRRKSRSLSEFRLPRIRPAILLAGAGAVGLLIWRLSDATQGVQAVSTSILNAFDWAKTQAFRSIIPVPAQQYADIILRTSQDVGVSPFVTVGLGMRETGWGTTTTPQGSGGWGDFTPRNGQLPPSDPDTGERRGWGFGLLQIDYASFKSWLDQYDWRDPETNIRKGLEIFKGHLDFFAGNASLTSQASSGPYTATDGNTVHFVQSAMTRFGVSSPDLPDPRPLAGDELLRAALAAYNTGRLNVLRALAAGKSPDFTTTGGDYSSWISQRVDDWGSQLAQA